MEVAAVEERRQIGEPAAVVGRLVVDNIDSTQHSYCIHRRLHKDRTRSTGHIVHYNPQRMESQKPQRVWLERLNCQGQPPQGNYPVVGIAETDANNHVDVVDIDCDGRRNLPCVHRRYDDGHLETHTRHNFVVADFL